ncbi:MAG: hypothetical protein CM1200mP10_15370 [Candidatus Neomarinimicrobiota bacterium]|nr:MAG: hypothetical protein CM1200mP10_15370 [Candidatus Neomarinimicrobiota bacterium]
MDTLAFDPFASFIKAIVIVATILVIVISRNSNEFKGYHTGEYYVLLAVMVFGMFLMASAIDLIMVYLSIEIVSLCLYSGRLFEGKNPVSQRGFIKICYLWCIFIRDYAVGLSIIFGLTGTTNYFESGMLSKPWMVQLI